LNSERREGNPGKDMAFRELIVEASPAVSVRPRELTAAGKSEAIQVLRKDGLLAASL
jgi:hypothetical protein